MFSPLPQGGWQRQVAGDLLPFVARPVVHRNHVLPVWLPAGQGATVYLRLTSQGTLAAPLRLWRPAALWQSDQGSYALLSLYFGLLAGLFLYNLLLFTGVGLSVAISPMIAAAIGLAYQVGAGAALQDSRIEQSGAAVADRWGVAAFLTNASLPGLAQRLDAGTAGLVLSAALLAVLAVARGRTVGRERLIGLALLSASIARADDVLVFAAASMKASRATILRWAGARWTTLWPWKWSLWPCPAPMLPRVGLRCGRDVPCRTRCCPSPCRSSTLWSGPGCGCAVRDGSVPDSRSRSALSCHR